MINIKKLNAVNLKVRDLDQSMKWYKDHFGFEKIYEVEGGVVVGRDGVEIVLSPSDTPDAELADPCKDLCIHTLAFEVSKEDLDRVLDEFPEDDEIVEIDHPRFKSYITEDCNGYCIELFTEKKDD